MPNFTSSLPEKTLNQLAITSKKLKVPKNQIIEMALNLYLEHLEKEMYIASFKKLSSDKEMKDLADEGMEEYADELNKWDEKG